MLIVHLQKFRTGYAKLTINTRKSPCCISIHIAQERRILTFVYCKLLGLRAWNLKVWWAVWRLREPLSARITWGFFFLRCDSWLVAPNPVIFHETTSLASYSVVFDSTGQELLQVCRPYWRVWLAGVSLQNGFVPKPGLRNKRSLLTRIFSPVGWTTTGARAIK